MADWKKIKTEYITTDTSYRKLAQKYGVSYNVIGERSRKENWMQLRDQHRAKTLSKTVEKISERQADRAARIGDVADKLLDRIEAIVDDDVGEMLPAKSIRALVVAVKDLKEIQGVRSDLDRREQEARIANLQKQAAKNDDNNSGTITIQLAGGLDKYAQ